MAIVDELRALGEGVAVIARESQCTLRLAGPDRVRFLNGMVTNDVTNLGQGQGVRAIKTNNRGRVEALMRVRTDGDAFLLDADAVVADKLRATLDMFIIMDDCTIADVSGDRAVIALLGPKARSIIEAVGWALPEADAPPASFVQQDGRVVIVDDTFGVDGFEIHVAVDRAAADFDALVSAGATPASVQALDVARVERGVPVDERDVGDDTIPLEARLQSMISFTKGCYVGQEVISRATNLGQVNYLLVGVKLGEAIDEGAELFAGDRRVGEVTSVVDSPTHGTIALAYVHRKHEAPGTVLAARSDDRSVEATVVALPFCGA